MLLVCGWLALCATARAQQPVFHWHVMGGYSDTLGTTADFLQGGPIVGGGFSVAPSASSPVDFRFDLSYSYHNASNALINSGQQATNIYIDGGNGQIWSLSGNLQLHIPITYGVRGYLIAGIGAYHTLIQLTQSGYGYYNCDPFSGFCYGSDNAVVASNDVTKFGWNAGLGVLFDLPYGRAWFIETRYHRIDTTTPIEYLPIEIGYRF
jgi:hypothetical protein